MHELKTDKLLLQISPDASYDDIVALERFIKAFYETNLIQKKGFTI
jgi:hypothetical protein